jgi:two-component system CheB/CheR fusion protein
MPSESTHSGDRSPLLIVGVGASAGGITALQQFFTHADPSADAAYVVILHLSPDHESHLPEVLQRVTTMRVIPVAGQVELVKGSVYVVSPNQSLSAVDGTLAVSGITRLEQRRSPVDMFFRTLADTHAGHAVCIVLSGTGSDGSNGLKRVKEHGGLAIAQDPGEAQHPDMPGNAIATGLVDYVLPVAEMPARIAAYARQLLEPGVDAELLARADSAADQLRDVLTLLRLRTGQDFSNYKPPTVQRRVARRMNLLGVPTLAEYARAVRDQPGEAAALMAELLISVTNFFRDPEVFATLQHRVLPRILDGKRNDDQLRVWVAGCATGEEAYSIAMVLAEAVGTSADAPSIQVFATDLDQRAISVAREGFYPDADLADVSEARIQRFFEKEATGYRVRRDLREMILFAHHNLIKDPPFSHLDLISCRNLLIYLNRSIQDRIIETFHFALRPGGHLLLGASESPEGTNDLFQIADKDAHIYQSRSAIGRLSLPRVESALLPPQERTAVRASASRPVDRLFPADLHQRLLEQYAPPSIVVSDEYAVVHISENGGRYLTVSAGEPSRDLLRLVRPELRGDLRTALHQAAQQRASVAVRGIRLDGPGEPSIAITVRPVLREGDPARGFFLVLFEEETTINVSQPPTVELTTDTEPLNRHLEDELGRVKGQLRTTVEQYETQVEEAKASNEELQAMNEELRSSAEELETSKEELQSVNEELTTVNQELKIKIEELGLTNNDFKNLLNASDVGTIFLDRALRVKLSTPGAQRIFNLRPGDVGRPLSDLTSRLIDDHMDETIPLVVEQLQTVEREVESRDGRWYLMRMFPYRTTDDRIDGAVITFHDITAARHHAASIRASEERLRLLIDGAIDYAIFTMTLDGTIDSWNVGAERMFGYTSSEIIGTSADVLFTPEDRAAGVPAAEISKAAATGRAEDERWHVRKDGSRLYCSGVTSRLGGSPPMGLAKIARDLTARQQAERAVQEAEHAVDTRVEQRTSVLSAEVQQHVAAEQHVTQLMRKLVTSQEDQRARIARDLHDHLGQQLTALRLTLERHREQCAGEGAVNLEQAIEQARALDSEIDFLAWELRPALLDDLGLSAALPRYVEEWSRHFGIAAECRAGAYRRDLLLPEVEVSFYRVAQEALNNVSKHAHASHVDVLLEHRDDGTVALTIEDDGVGFELDGHDGASPGLDPAPGLGVGLGLAGMRERAALIGATLDIESTPSQGTTIFLRYRPVPRRLEAAREPH